MSSLRGFYISILLKLLKLVYEAEKGAGFPNKWTDPLPVTGCWYQFTVCCLKFMLILQHNFQGKMMQMMNIDTDLKKYVFSTSFVMSQILQNMSELTLKCKGKSRAI